MPNPALRKPRRLASPPSRQGCGNVEKGADPGAAGTGRAIAGSMKLLIYLTMMVGAGCQALAGERAESVSALDRVTYAADGAESSHGKDRAMWPPDAAGPQGPGQVS